MCDKCNTMGRPRKRPQDKASSSVVIKMRTEQKRKLARIAKRNGTSMAGWIKARIDMEVEV